MVDFNTTIRSGVQHNTSQYANFYALVADEFEHSRQSIRQMLLATGIGNVDQTSTGKGVIDACISRKYDVILCDYRLGQGKNGQQILEELRQLKLLKSDAIFIVVSAETNRDIVFGIMESFPDDYLSKPFTQGVLNKRLERLFAQNTALSDMKKALADQDYPTVISLCDQHINNKGRYSVWCKKTLVDSYLAQQDWPKLTKLCEQELSARDIDWAMLGIAKMHVAKEDWDQAISYLESLLKSFPQCVPAYDLLAKSLEKKGRYAKAQEVLEEGLRLSPLVASRQQTMVDVSRENGDIQAAVKASQQTLKLLTNTINESADPYLQLADILSEASAELSGSERKKLSDEVFSTLNRMTKKYSENHELRVKRALSESRLYAYQGHAKQRDASLKTAMKLLDENPTIKTTDVSIQLGKTLFLAGRKDEAHDLWDLVQLDGDITPAQQKSIHDFLDDPIPIGARAKAKSINAEGLAHYTKKELDDAIRLFEEALKISPNNPGLNLNLVQTIIKKMETSGPNENLKAKCVSAFQRMKHVGRTHKQFNRLQALRSFMAKYK